MPAGAAPGGVEAPNPDSVLHRFAVDSVAEVPVAIALPAAIRLAARHNPRLAEAAWQVRAAQGHDAEGRRRPLPSVEATVEDWGGGLGTARTEATFGLSQPLELGGDRAARSAMGRAGVEVARAELGRELRDLVAGVTTEFVGAWVAQERVRGLLESRKIAAEAVTAAAERVREGAASPVERIRAEGRLALAEAELGRAEAVRAAAARTLALRWGAKVAAFDSLVLPAPDISSPPPVDSLLLMLEEHPELARTAAETRRAEARLRSARAGRVPDLSVLVGVRHLREARGAGFVTGLSLPLPPLDPRGGAVAAAAAERSRAALEQVRTRLELQSELRSVVDRLGASIAAWRRLEDGAVPAAEVALDAIRSAYRAGRLGYVDLVEGQRAALDARLATVEAAADVWRSRAELERLVGGPPPTRAGAER